VLYVFGNKTIEFFFGNRGFRSCGEMNHAEVEATCTIFWLVGSWLRVNASTLNPFCARRLPNSRTYTFIPPVSLPSSEASGQVWYEISAMERLSMDGDSLL